MDDVQRIYARGRMRLSAWLGHWVWVAALGLTAGVMGFGCSGSKDLFAPEDGGMPGEGDRSSSGRGDGGMGPRCADGGVRTACGSCDPGCLQVGKIAFPTTPPNPGGDASVQPTGVRLVDRVKLDDHGDLTLGKVRNEDFDYMWIANTDDVAIPGALGTGRGTISKIDTRKVREVARYFTVTCSSRQGDTCLDVNGKPIRQVFQHRPSRTAVDINFDVWVANRAGPDHWGQPSVTRIANELSDCTDRNGNGQIETSADRNGDGRIDYDCNSDGQADGAGTACTKPGLAGGAPEFYGDDDECVLFTASYGEEKDFGRSVCIGPVALDQLASEAWVGTNNRDRDDPARPNVMYRISVKGEVGGPFELPKGHHPYGCVVDRQHILWSPDAEGGPSAKPEGTGTLAYLDTRDPGNPQKKGMIKPPEGMLYRLASKPQRHFYGITLDPNDNIWLGGWQSHRIWRYRPKRDSVATLGQGTWAAVAEPDALYIDAGSRGIAADKRGRIWVAFHGGFIGRIDQSKLSQGNIEGSVVEWQGAGGKHWPMNHIKDGQRQGVGVGVDNQGHVWGIDYAQSLVSRLDVDDKGDPIETKSTLTDPGHRLPVGFHPYTYSDFTGYGLRNFTLPLGRYQYQLAPCPGEDSVTDWSALSWSATTPPGTSLQVRVRSGETETTLGEWVGPFSQSPADLTQQPKLTNPAPVLRLEFIFKSSDDGGSAPVLHSFGVGYSCKQRLH